MKKSCPAFVPSIMMTLLAVCAAGLVSCKKKEAAAEEPVVESSAAEEAPALLEEAAPAVPQAGSSGVKFDFVPLSGDYHTDAHAAYLKDRFEFASLDQDGKIEGGKTYLLVASNEAQLYGADAFNFVKGREDYGDGSEWATLKNPAGMKGESIPIGSFFPKESIVRSGGEEWYEQSYGYFLFQDNYNFFYKVSWNGKEGYVFGADLKEVWVPEDEAEGGSALQIMA